MNNQICQLVSLSLRPTMRVLLAVLCCMVLATLARAQDVAVPGTSGYNWVNTGLDIAPGTLLQLSATGRVDMGYDWGSYGPEGTTQFAPGLGYPSDNGSVRYGLVARHPKPHFP